MLDNYTCVHEHVHRYLTLDRMSKGTTGAKKVCFHYNE